VALRVARARWGWACRHLRFVQFSLCLLFFDLVREFYSEYTVRRGMQQLKWLQVSVAFSQRLNSFSLVGHCPQHQHHHPRRREKQQSKAPNREADPATYSSSAAQFCHCTKCSRLRHWFAVHARQGQCDSWYFPVGANKQCRRSRRPGTPSAT
jgi:hypothetical protein